MYYMSVEVLHSSSTVHEAIVSLKERVLTESLQPAGSLVACKSEPGASGEAYSVCLDLVVEFRW